MSDARRLEFIVVNRPLEVSSDLLTAFIEEVRAELQDVLIDTPGSVKFVAVTVEIE